MFRETDSYYLPARRASAVVGWRVAPNANCAALSGRDRDLVSSLGRCPGLKAALALRAEKACHNGTLWTGERLAGVTFLRMMILGIRLHLSWSIEC